FKKVDDQRRKDRSLNRVINLIVFAGLLGIFLTPTLADYDIDVNDNNNSGGSGQQSVSVNNEHGVANIDNNNGWGSWNSLWDYGSGFAVIRSFKKKSCFVHKMNKEVMPSIQALGMLAKKNKLQGRGPEGPPPKSLIYSVKPDKVNNLDQFGESVVTMCKGIPTYMAEEIQEANPILYPEKCFKVDILWILNISLCEEAMEN
uniref:Gastrokine 1 n=1 Tax=Ovis aries TaxID=9940 RepID=A0AC11B3M2_SHEEP